MAKENGWKVGKTAFFLEDCGKAWFQAYGNDRNYKIRVGRISFLHEETGQAALSVTGWFDTRCIFVPSSMLATSAAGAIKAGMDVCLGQGVAPNKITKGY